MRTTGAPAQRTRRSSAQPCNRAVERCAARTVSASPDSAQRRRGRSHVGLRARDRQPRAGAQQVELRPGAAYLSGSRVQLFFTGPGLRGSTAARRRGLILAAASSALAASRSARRVRPPAPDPRTAATWRARQPLHAALVFLRERGAYPPEPRCCRDRPVLGLVAPACALLLACPGAQLIVSCLRGLHRRRRLDILRSRPGAQFSQPPARAGPRASGRPRPPPAATSVRISTRPAGTLALHEHPAIVRPPAGSA
jgi:hypothetical protein